LLVTIKLIQNLAVTRYTETAFSPAMVGVLNFTTTTNESTGAVSVTCTNATNGSSQLVLVNDVANSVGAPFTLLFDTLGFQITGETTVNYTNPLFTTTALRTAAIAAAICTATDLVVYAAIPVEITIPFGPSTLPARVDANLSLGNYQGWVLYNTPSQTELTADSNLPNNKWQPYFGDYSTVPALSSAVVTAITSDVRTPLTLVNGTNAQSFQYVWNAWELRSPIFMQAVCDGTSSTLVFTLLKETALYANRLSVYINGQTKPLTNVLIINNIVDLTELSPNLGDMMTIIYAPYTPSSSDLAFNPDANPTGDNPIILYEYKYDYQYTSKEIRDSNGNLTDTLYYFWVANKSLETYGRTISVQGAAELLAANTDPYIVFQNISNEIGETPSYNQIVTVGLNTYVTEDNTYKIRFTRDFVLRDDPRNERLKNVHTEWTTIRELQTTLIPQQLWNILTDAASGYDAIGNPVPSLANVAYDERNGTTTQYGFGTGQAFVDQQLALASIQYAILNTSLTITTQANGGQVVPNPISFIDASNIVELFSTPTLIRQTMGTIWSDATPTQVNEIFFTVLYDALAENYEFTDIFKTSMISARSTRLFNTGTST